LRSAPFLRPDVRQQFFKSAPRTAGAGIVTAQLLDEFDLAALDEPAPALDVRLAGEAVTPLAYCPNA